MPLRDSLGLKRNEADKINLLPMPTVARFIKEREMTLTGKRYLEKKQRNQLREEASRNVGKAAYVAEEVSRKKGDC